MSARRLSVVQQVHHHEALAGGAVHVLCPPLQAGKQRHASTSVLCKLASYTHMLNVANRHYKGAECKDSRQADPTVKEKA